MSSFLARIVDNYRRAIKYRRFSARNLAKLLLPPILFKLSSRPTAPDDEYVGDRWPQDDPRSFGWDDPSIVRSQCAKWEAYKRAVDGTGPLVFQPWNTGERIFNAHNILMTYGYVLARAAYGKKRLSVLDWGGALGHYAAVGNALLPECALEFTVKERPNFCAAGRELMPNVSFTSSDDCTSRRYDLVLASGSLQYAADWQSLAHQLANAAESWLFVTQIPVVRQSHSFVVVQHPQRFDMGSDYISWVFNRDELLAHVKRLGLNLEREFYSFGDGRRQHAGAPDSSESMGFLFRRPSSGQNRTLEPSQNH